MIETDWLANWEFEEIPDEEEDKKFEYDGGIMPDFEDDGPITYVEPTLIDNTQKMLGNVVVGLTENPLQDMFMESMLDGVSLPVEVHTLTGEKDLKKVYKFKHNSIFDTPLMLKFVVEGKKSNAVENFLLNLSVKNRLVIIQFAQPFMAESFFEKFNQMYHGQVPITNLPSAETYGEKKQLIETFLNAWKIAFDSAQTKEMLVSLMIRNDDRLESVKLSLKIARANKKMVDFDFLDSLFDGVDYYSLDDWVITVFRGTKPKKKLEILSYFISDKEYPPAYMVSFIRESLLTLHKMYMAYAQGIILHKLDSVQLEKRLKAAEFPNYEDLTALKPRQLENYLDAVKDIPYQYFTELVQLVFHKSYHHAKKADLMRLLTEIDVLLEKYDAKKGFQNQRQLNAVIQNNRSKPKKKV